MSEQFPPHNLETGTGRMEAAAEAKLRQNEQERALEAHRHEQNRALEARSLTPAVQALNDRAELEIYGSKSHT
ncbi:MAG: hypothetical protein ACREGF_07025, partial [Candidatus Saccharimonadales bacterium]